MTKEREALTMSLAALEIYGSQAPAVHETITAIKEALAQPEQEPVNWSVDDSGAEVVSDLIFAETFEYLSPPKREWVGLTPANFERLEQLYSHHVASDFALANIVCMAETILKEKNA